MTSKKKADKHDILDANQTGINTSETEKQEETKVKTQKASKKAKKEKELEEELLAAKLKHEELNDKYLRLFSEFDNYRKRTLKERIELSKTATEEVITDLLTVIDDFERALQSIEKDKAESEGISLIYNKLIKILQQKGLQEIEAKGSEFDTDFHEALTNVPTPDEQMKGKVMDVIQKGYTLNGKVIRYARVVVGA